MSNRTVSFGVAAMAATTLVLIAPAAQARYRPQPDSVHIEALKRQAGQPTLKTWSHSYTYGGKTYKYVMVGSDPSVGSATTTVPTYIVPVIVKFPNGTKFDPTKPGQEYTSTPLSVLLASPIFKNYAFTAGKVNVGTTQYVDAFQRANFWSQVSTKASGYHVLLSYSPTILPAMTYTAAGNSIASGPGGFKYGTISENGIDFAIQKYIAAHPTITPNSLPIFLTYDVYTDQSCGYHSNTGNQTYAFSVFDDKGVDNCDATQGDIETMTHEIAEWMDDPFDNVTPDKTHILEVGDPAQDNSFSISNSAKTFTYTLQDLMFHDWFTCSLPSSSVNGWFDFLNKFSKNDC